MACGIVELIEGLVDRGLPSSLFLSRSEVYRILLEANTRFLNTRSKFILRE